MVTSGSSPSRARASIAASRSSSTAWRPAMKRDQPFLEGAILPAPSHPDVAGAQPVTQFRQYAQFVVTPVDAAVRQDVGRPALPDEACRHDFRQGGGA